MTTVHISESEASTDFPGRMAKVRAGTEFIVESDTGPIAVVRAPKMEFRPRLLSDLIAEGRTLEANGAAVPVFDDDFADPRAH